MADNILKCNFIEKELVDINFAEKELINIELAVIDVIPRKTYITELSDVLVTTPANGDILIYKDNYWRNKEVVFGETPTKINSKRFRTNKNYLSTSLQVFLNGIKEKEITQISSSLFEFSIDTEIEDTIEVNYIEA